MVPWRAWTVVACLALIGCRSPTEISVEISTEEACAAITGGTAIAVGGSVSVSGDTLATAAFAEQCERDQRQPGRHVCGKRRRSLRLALSAGVMKIAKPL